MTLTSSVIETGVDKLVNLINTKGRISSADAAKELGVSTTIVMEWADFLEEEGIINMEYKFAKPFLVARKLGKKDVKEKAKEFSGKKEVFVRKAEISLSFLEKESDKLKSLKEEFDKIKKELGLDIGSIKNDLMELKKYEDLKINLDKKLQEQKTTSMNKLGEVTNRIISEKEKYQNILAEVQKEEEILEHDKIEAKSLEESEKLINEKLNGLREIIKQVGVKANTEEESIKNSEEHIKKLELLAKATQARVEKEKELIQPLLEQSENQMQKIKELQETIIKKIASKENKMKDVKEASKKMKAFFNKKLGVMNFIEKINKDRDDLQNELIDLVKKARSFQLSSKSRNTGNQIIELEKKFKDVNDKKKVFEKELKKLGAFFK
tara:strand:- start:25249 stop:26391 length:1143 start_codon:yes stop_codon:yes gene_type:complete